MNKFGFARISVVSPLVSIGNPAKNAEEILKILEGLKDSDIVVFPELCITGYTCGDLFQQKLLLDQAEKAIAKIANDTDFRNQLVFVGAPIAVRNELFNCAVGIYNGKILGIIPKQNIPNYNEFYEFRWFRAGDGDEPTQIQYAGKTCPFGIDLMFGNDFGVLVYPEVCEDLWMPIPPSSYAAIMGANVLVNLSASNETVAKCEYRTDLVKNQSGRCVAVYAYASAGPTESTTDLVFGGHCLIAENSRLLIETDRVGDGKGLVRENKIATTDVDIEKLQTERRRLTSFGDAQKAITRKFRTIEFHPEVRSQYKYHEGLLRFVDGQPFIPRNPETLQNRCTEITDIQVASLAKRIEMISSKKIFIGISGGLDSTLALLVAVKTYEALGLPLKNITGITMPGFGTTNRTKNNALTLMGLLGITSKHIDIRAMCLETYKAEEHKPFGINLESTPDDSEMSFVESLKFDGYDVQTFSAALQKLTSEQIAAGDLNFENVQARIRTLVLMSHGSVLGTGDLSELALGWCTYNGDHMSMFNVNCSIPKTLVRFLVNHIAKTQPTTELGNSVRAVLEDIVDTMISPELLPHAADQITQSTEDSIGPYELHDFFIVNFLRNGFSPEKIMFLSDHATFSKEYSRELREKTLRTFLKRFFSQQFKRSCVPDGPKVGSVSLSPRGDLRMPSDADVEMWLK